MTEYLEPEEYDACVGTEGLFNQRFTTDCPDNPVVIAIFEAMREAHKEHPPVYRTCRCIGNLSATDFAYATMDDKDAVRAAMDEARDREMPKDSTLSFNALDPRWRLALDFRGEACACPFRRDGEA